MIVQNEVMDIWGDDEPAKVMSWKQKKWLESLYISPEYLITKTTEQVLCLRAGP